MGPLNGVKVVEIAGIGPGPFACMLLADLGADVVRIDRTAKGAGSLPMNPSLDLLNRSRRSAAVDLKSPEGVALALELISDADILIEGFRPGVMERLGLGPDVCFEQNPQLIYGRMTGWGQNGPLASAAGHDINYIALSGVLHSVGRAGARPTVPLNLAGDFGGGSMFLVMGVLAALLESKTSGKGQVVDAAMVDGSSTLMTFFHACTAMGLWNNHRGTNLFDSGAPFYDAFETSDGKYVSIGSLEFQFYRELLELLELTDEPDLANHFDPSKWPIIRARFEEVFKQKTRDEWCELLEGTDVCFAPVLSLSEATEHPHMKERDAFVEVAGVVQPSPAPRFSRSQTQKPTPPATPGQHTLDVLRDWGIDDDRLQTLQRAGTIRQG